MLLSYAYFGALLLSLGGLAVLDRRYNLAFFHDRRATIIALLVSLVIFLAWDVAGILLGIFYVGPSPYLSGIRLAPELPLEEPFFLVLLSYNALLVWRAGERRWPRI